MLEGLQKFNLVMSRHYAGGPDIEDTLEAVLINLRTTHMQALLDGAATTNMHYHLCPIGALAVGFLAYACAPEGWVDAYHQLFVRVDANHTHYSVGRDLGTMVAMASYSPDSVARVVNGYMDSLDAALTGLVAGIAAAKQDVLSEPHADIASLPAIPEYNLADWM